MQLVAALQAQEGSGVEFLAVYDQDQGEVRITSLKGAAVTVTGRAETVAEFIGSHPVLHREALGSLASVSIRARLSDDDRRIMLQMKSQLPFGSLNLYLRTQRIGTTTTSSVGTP